MKKLLILLLLISQIAIAQNISVLSNKKILDSNTEYYYPHFSLDGEKIAVTGQNFTGLYVLDLETKRINQVTEKQGAGYEPVFSNDASTIYFRWNEYEGLKKYSSISSMNLDNGETSLIESKKRNLSPPQMVSNNLVYTIEYEPGNEKGDQNSNAIWVCIENQKIAFYQNDEKKILAPKGNGNYIWPELSPDQTKILFTFAGHGTFICDLSGNIVADLGYLNASKWLNDSWIVGTKDYDNGKVVTDSDIFAISMDGQKQFQLTHTDNKIEMYPDCLLNQSKIAYHTLDGDIYIMTLKFN